jgi:hypothetical protein
MIGLVVRRFSGGVVLVAGSRFATVDPKVRAHASIPGEFAVRAAVLDVLDEDLQVVGVAVGGITVNRQLLRGNPFRVGLATAATTAPS